MKTCQEVLLKAANSIAFHALSPAEKWTILSMLVNRYDWWIKGDLGRYIIHIIRSKASWILSLQSRWRKSTFEGYSPEWRADICGVKMNISFHGLLKISSCCWKYYSRYASFSHNNLDPALFSRHHTRMNFTDHEYLLENQLLKSGIHWAPKGSS